MQRWMRKSALIVAAAAAGLFWGTTADAQVTTGSIRGIVTDSAGIPLEGARITATHVPSGTLYSGASRADGKFTIGNMRVGGPYTVAAIRIGFARQTTDGINVGLGLSTDMQFQLGPVATTLGAVTVTSTNEVSSTRTGAATTISQEAIRRLPTISGRLDDFARLTPQASGSSFAGQDSRLNNITVDGSSFNNSFGLGSAPGDRTGVTPISLEAIEAVQINVAPFDVRYGNFVGAAVNTVTKSGGNDYSGSLYYQTRDNSLVGRRAGANKFNPGTFDFERFGASLSGPIMRNKLFFFLSYEQDELAEPSTTFRANNGGEAVTGSVTRVNRSTLDSLGNYLRTNFNYDPGSYDPVPFAKPSQRLIAKFDWAMNDQHKFILRYNQLESSSDVIMSNSTSLGIGNRRTNLNSLTFENSNYVAMENIKSVIGEWNSTLGDRFANSLSLGWTKQDESREQISVTFPTVDILGPGGTMLTSLGPDPFTPSNQLRYSTLQFVNNFTMYGDAADWTFGVAYERYKSENVFFDGSASVYVYNSLNDFYADANGYLANPNRTTSTVYPNRFQVRYSNIIGQVEPVQPLEVSFASAYVQTELRVTRDLKMTFGLRADVPKFGETGYTNTQANGYTFRDEDGLAVQYSTQQLPTSRVLYSPRVGLNWDLRGDGVTQIRGGSGVFTGRPAYVWISNQIGNNGVITGFIDNRAATGAQLPGNMFNPNPDAYKQPANGAAAASYALAFTEKDFRFPQVWRTNAAIDRKLPWNLVGTAELLFAKDINGLYYIDANLSAPEASFTGPDQRPRWSVDDCPTVSGTQQRLNCNVTSAIVLKNQDVGEAWNASLSLERAFSNGLFMKAAYARGMARNTVDPGSIAIGSFQSNPHSGNPNQVGRALSGTSQGLRFFTTVAYSRDWFKVGATGFSIYAENRRGGNNSFTYDGDMNGDGSTSNDLMYIPRSGAEILFVPITGTTPFTVAQQVAAWDEYQARDGYLDSHRGQYAQRGALWLPGITRADVSFTQEVGTMFNGKPNKLALRLDILNFTNMINTDWGVFRGFTARQNQPLIAAGTSPAGVPQFRMRVIGSALQGQTFQKTNSETDVWRIQMSVKYTFNR